MLATSGPRFLRLSAMLMVVALTATAGTAQAQILPWEVAIAEIESGRLRNLAERLSKQNVLYQFRLGDVTKSDLIKTSTEIDRVLGSLSNGNPSYSIPAPWTPALRERITALDRIWGPLRKMAVASPYDYIRVARDFLEADSRRGDPLLIRYFDQMAGDFVDASEKLLAAYDEECLETGIEVCPTARTSGYAAMLIERATKEAVCVVAGIESAQNRSRLEETIRAYHVLRDANNESPFFAAALNPERGPNALAAGELLTSLRSDWDAMQAEITMLTAGDEQNFDIRRLLAIQTELAGKVERLTAALVRYASATYGS